MTYYSNEMVAIATLQYAKRVLETQRGSPTARPSLEEKP